jgi:hypothetical protein
MKPKPFASLNHVTVPLAISHTPRRSSLDERGQLPDVLDLRYQNAASVSAGTDKERRIALMIDVEPGRHCPISAPSLTLGLSDGAALARSPGGNFEVTKGPKGLQAQKVKPA